MTSATSPRMTWPGEPSRTGATGTRSSGPAWQQWRPELQHSTGRWPSDSEKPLLRPAMWR